jgi:hypothetical protein
MSVGFGHHLLPLMNTDTSLFDGTRTIIVECKWTPHTLHAGRGAKKTLNEEHLRQLHTYMAHHTRTISCSGVVEGLLLYPLADEPVDIELMIKGQTLRVRTIDLATGWPDIRAQMLSLLSDARRSYAAKNPRFLNRSNGWPFLRRIGSLVHEIARSKLQFSEVRSDEKIYGAVYGFWA